MILKKINNLSSLINIDLDAQKKWTNFDVVIEDNDLEATIWEDGDIIFTPNCKHEDFLIHVENLRMVVALTDKYLEMRKEWKNS